MEKALTEYELIRSRRKSLAIQVKPDGGVIVRAPLRLAKYRIERFITEHEDWIRMQQKKVEKIQRTDTYHYRRRAAKWYTTGKENFSGAYGIFCEAYGSYV